jgi:mannosyltransferase
MRAGRGAPGAPNIPPVSIGSLTPPASRIRASAWSRRDTRSLACDRGLLLLAGLIVLAAVLRFYNLGHQGFWFDEGNTALEVKFTVGQMLTLLKHYESTPPLYYGIAWVWSRIFGDTETGLRSLSAVLGVLSVPVAYGAASRLVSRRAGLTAAALVAFNPYLIWYSQEARAYSLVVVLTGAGLWAFACARTQPTARSLGAWTAISILALATEYYSFLVILPEALWLLHLHRSRRELWISLGCIAGCAAPLVWFAVSQNATGHASWIAPLPLGPRLGQIVPQFLVGYGSPAYAVLTRVAEAVGLLGVGLLWARTHPVARSGALLAGGIALAGVGISLVLAAGGIDDIISRNLISLWIPAAVALAGGLAARRARRVGLVATAVLCALGVTAAAGVAVNQSLQRPDWRKLARLLGPPPPGGRAILLQRYRTLLPLSLYMPSLRFLGYGHARVARATVSEFDVVALQAPRVELCWWGATCNLSPSRIHATYPIPGLRVVWRRTVYPFTVQRMVPAGGHTTLTAAEARRRFNANYINARLAARKDANGLLIEP